MLVYPLEQYILFANFWFTWERKKSFNRISRRWSVIFQLHQNWSLWPVSHTFFSTLRLNFISTSLSNIFFHLKWMKSFFSRTTNRSVLSPSCPHIIVNLVRVSFEFPLKYGQFLQSFTQNINWINVSNGNCHDTFKLFDFAAIHRFGYAVSDDKGLPSKCCQFLPLKPFATAKKWNWIFFWNHIQNNFRETCIHICFA